MDFPPQDLVKYYSEEAPLLAFKSQYPSPQSSAEAECMQDAYTMIYVCQRTLDDNDTEDGEEDPALVPTIET